MGVSPDECRLDLRRHQGRADARDMPQAAHCRSALITGLALYGANAARTVFITHRNSIARLFWSLLEDRKSHPIESRAVTRLARLPTFAIPLPASLRARPAQANA